jgi:hypothetical protein
MLTFIAGAVRENQKRLRGSFLFLGSRLQLLQVCILRRPGALLCRVVDLGFHQIFQRAEIFFQIENAIVQLK